MLKIRKNKGDAYDFEIINILLFIIDNFFNYILYKRNSRFLTVLFNNGTRNQVGFKKAVGFSVINIGVSNLNQTIRTDLANK
jgi:hypothetical protein